ncbi:MAG TPA: uroporphyrinogen-III synthase [Acidimicrobiia bacterium]|jgi:uroporphyrinogen-III synthase
MRPSLQDTVVLVTRPREEGEDLAAMLEARGATVLLAPAIELAPAPRGELDRAANELMAGGYAWAVFTSKAGVEALMSRLPPGAAVPARVGAVGEGTAEALRGFGVDPDLVPTAFTTAALGRAFPKGSGRVLLARADIAPDGLEAALAAKGWTPVRVDAYRTRLVRSLPGGVGERLLAGEVDAVTFTSVSTVQGFLAAAGTILSSAGRVPVSVCIGPVTAEAARAAGLTVAGVAQPHTIEGLVKALERALRSPRRAKKES